MLFILVTFTILLGFISLSRHNSIINNNYFNNSLLTIMLLASAVVVGMRDIPFGTDSFAYQNTFLTFQSYSLKGAIKIGDQEPLFVIWQWLVGRLFSSPQSFFIITYLLFSIILIFAFTRIVEKRFVVFLFFGYMSLSFYENLITNIIRQGLAISLVILAVCLYLKTGKRTLSFFLILALALLFHYSAAPIIILSLINVKKIKLRNLLIIWFIFLIPFLLKTKNLLIAPFASSKVLSTYSSEYAVDLYGGGVYRTDFLLFSFFFILIGLYMRRLCSNNVKYELLLKIYILFNLYFLTFGSLPFSERFALYSWILIPLLIWYPLSIIEKKKSFAVFGVYFLFLSIAIITGSFDYLI
ncbi:EpsG family protein [Priestia filamentosa]|uniref:EpsG family protein n=1 Tax=Priestia filamentosa TaxID=1402861 RepID=UPI003D2B8FCF